MTKGELKIAQILTKNHIKFQQEKSFSDLKNGKFRFDFYVEGALPYPVLIEYDGEQHFQQVKIFQKNRADFLRTQGHDRQKCRWALAHNIPLYRIPYWKLDSINTINDIFNKEYLVKTAYHNDDIWKNYQNSRAKNR